MMHSPALLPAFTEIRRKQTSRRQWRRLLRYHLCSNGAGNGHFCRRSQIDGKLPSLVLMLWPTCSALLEFWLLLMCQVGLASAVGSKVGGALPAKTVCFGVACWVHSSCEHARSTLVTASSGLPELAVTIALRFGQTHTQMHAHSSAEYSCHTGNILIPRKH